MKKKKRIVIHVDMDHFFTAVEERENPELMGKAVVVGADPKEGEGRGVVSTCNYTARKFGVRSGMPISRAWKLCPDAVFLPVNYRLYRKVSKRIISILRGYASSFERWGIDEAFLDVTSRIEDYNEAKALAHQIKKEILEEEELKCSIGVGPNKLVAKIASDFEKPDGLTVVREEDAERFLAPLDVRKLLWVGKKTARRLREMGIETIGDLASYDPAVLRERFGVSGTQLQLMAHGIDGSEVQEACEVRSISRELTFEEDTDDSEFILDIIDRLSEEVHKDALEQALFFKTVTVKIRFEDFETHTHGKTLSFPTDRLQDLKKVARELTQEYLGLDREIRLVGVRISNFMSAERQKRLM